MTPSFPPEAEQGAPLGTGSAGGKVIIVGEHVVLHGSPAIAVPVPTVCATASVWPKFEESIAGERLRIEAHFPPGTGREPLHLGLHDTGPLPAVANAALRLLGLDDAPWQVMLESSVPPGRGMGSSGAVSVALARALLSAGGARDPQRVASAALAGERAVHGTPSGIDHHTILTGLPTWLEHGQFESLRVDAPLTLLIGDSGERNSTGALIADLGRRRERRPQSHVRWADRIRTIAYDARRAMARGDVALLGRALDANHLVLQAMRLSTPGLNGLIAAARHAGAAGAKLSGAGGGGVMIALVTPTSEDDVHTAMEQAGALAVWRVVVPRTDDTAKTADAARGGKTASNPGAARE